MKRFIVGLTACMVVGLTGLSPGARADEPGKQASADPAKELKAIQNEWINELRAFSKAYQAAKPADRPKLLGEKRPKPDAYADRALKLAEAHPRDPVALKALAWVVSNALGTPLAEKATVALKEKVAAATDLDQLQKLLAQIPSFGMADIASQVAEMARKNLDKPQAPALLVWAASASMYGGTPETAKLYTETIDLLMERFVDRPEVAVVADWLKQDDNPAWAEKHLRRLMDKNPSEQVKDQARYALAFVLKNKDEASQPEAEKLLQAVIAELSKGPSQDFMKKQRLDEAQKELEDMKLHGLGKTAPEITGEDIDGKAFKLSDYKGKVVLLDFWGNW